MGQLFIMIYTLPLDFNIFNNVNQFPDCVKKVDHKKFLAVNIHKISVLF